MADSWVPVTKPFSIPKYAVIGGKDTDGSIIYVGRVNWSGETVHAQIIPRDKTALATRCGGYARFSDFEFLVGQNYKWVDGYSGGKFPVNAVASGKTKSGEIFYIGRIKLDNRYYYGKVQSSWKGIGIPTSGRIRRRNPYEVLVRYRKQPSTKPMPDYTMTVETVYHNYREGHYTCQRRELRGSGQPPISSIKQNDSLGSGMQRLQIKEI